MMRVERHHYRDLALVVLIVLVLVALAHQLNLGVHMSLHQSSHADAARAFAQWKVS